MDSIKKADSYTCINTKFFYEWFTVEYVTSKFLFNGLLLKYHFLLKWFCFSKKDEYSEFFYALFFFFLYFFWK